MQKIIIAFTNVGKLKEVTHREEELAIFFGTTKLGYPCEENIKKPFLIITDNDYYFSDEIPASLEGVGAIICYDDRDDNTGYAGKIQKLFEKLATFNVKKVQVVHHHNQNKEILTYIEGDNIDKNKFEPIKGEHSTGNSKYSAIIDIIVSLKKRNNGNFDVIKNATKNLGIDEVLEAKLNFLYQCLNPSSKPTEIKWEEAKIEFDIFITKSTVSADQFNKKNYVEPLRALRDKLLGEYES